MMSGIMPQDRHLFLAFPCIVHLRLKRIHLHTDQLIILLCLALHLVFPEIHQQKDQIRQTDGKSEKFRYRPVAGIKQTGKLRRGIVKNIIHQRQTSDDQQLPVRLRKQHRRRLADIAAQYPEYHQRHHNTTGIIAPLFSCHRQCEQSHPVTALAAQIGCEDRDQGRQYSEFIIQYQYQQKRHMD